MKYFSSFTNLKIYLSTGNMQYTTSSFFAKYCMCNIESDNDGNRRYHTNYSSDTYKLRVNKYEHDGFLGTTLSGTKNYVGGIDVTIHNDIADITYHAVNDAQYAKDYSGIYGNPINENDASVFNHAIFNYTEKIAKERNVHKLQCDVHENLKYYDSYISPNGFNISNDRADDNTFWIKTFKNI